MFLMPHDAGTELRIDSRDAAPGLDLGRYIHRGGARNFEHYFYEVDEYRLRTRDALRGAAGVVDFRRWSPGMPRACWVDDTERYQTIEGFYWELFQRDELTSSFYEAPAAPHVWLDVTYDPPILDPTEVTSTLLTPEETADVVAAAGDGDPSEFVRAPLQNESDYHGERFRGYTHLKRPLACTINGLEGNNAVLHVPNDQLLFSPQDWRHPEWYICEDENGVQLDSTVEWLTLRPGGTYRVHLRPRMWRWTVFVLAHYLIITPFETVPNDEYFTHIFFDRPPFYPYRHDVIHSKQTQGYPNWNGDMRSYDIGLDYHWEHTRAAGDLEQQIIEQQYSGYSITYRFLNNEDPDLFLEAWPSYQHDIVAVIERIDEPSETSHPVFVRQVVDLSDEFPKFTFGAFLARWSVAQSRI